MGEQLDAQHYTDGLEFLRFGTPSNNTSAERSGYGAEDTGHERSFATESGAVAVQPGEQSNARRLGTALGLPGSDIAPVLELGGWGVHVPYHTTWAHEAEAELQHGGERMRSIEGIAGLPAVIRELAALARG